MKVLVDLNVLLDVVLDRPPYARASSQSLGRIVSLRVLKGYVSQNAVTTFFYIVRKQAGLERARLAVRKVLAMLAVLPATKDVLVAATGEAYPDYEDAVTFLSAAAERCDLIVTRNPKDFASSLVPVQTPEQFLAAAASTAHRM